MDATTDQNWLVRHLLRLIETSKNPAFMCTYPNCDRVFSAKNKDFEVHTLSHIDRMPFKCTYPGCNRAYPGARLLKDHMLWHIVKTPTDMKPYRCNFPECDLAFVKAESAKDHMITAHTPCERPYLCPSPCCRARFRLRDGLGAHMIKFMGELDFGYAWHVDKKPYKCEIERCPCAFQTRTQLEHHMNSHKRPNYRYIPRTYPEERRIVALFDAHGVHYTTQYGVDLRCVTAREWHRARVDFATILHDTFVLLEIDEHQHNTANYSVSGDAQRMIWIRDSLTHQGVTLPIAFIRYNPHPYSVGDQPGPAQDVTVREKTLLDLICGTPESPHPSLYDGSPFKIVYMYYDCDASEDGTLLPRVHANPEYNPTLKPCCARPIV